MSHSAAPYTPPFPPRPERSERGLKLLAQARRDWLAIWPASAFRRETIFTRFLFRDVVICNSPETVHQAFVEQHEVFQRKSPQHRQALKPLLGDGLFVSDGKLWRERRRVVAPVTHASRLPDLAPVMTEAAASRAAAWAALPPGTVIDALAEMGHLTAEIICRTIFGRGLGADAAATVVSAFAEYQREIGQTDLASFLGLPEWLPRPVNRRARAAARRIHGVVDGLIETILAGGSGEASLIRSMAEARVPGTDRPMDRRAFRNEAIVLFMAGHETTANVLAWALFILSQDRASAARLEAELAATLGGRPAQVTDLPGLPFARAVVEETMRLYPPVPLLSRQAIGPGRIAGRDVRKGAVVLVAPWLLHRNTKVWDQPDAFIPDRFMPDAPRPPRHGYIPFSTGPRVCTGQQLGLVEAIICLATLWQAARLDLVEGTRVMPVARLTLRPGDGLPMRVLPRV
ncbi:cytochrome P450 [Falsiroseomonas ponticola]|uniref:cytochrome P450 n=1 Tax=Falsiroseomonas ponticola TaxID=2786951 RepID=UPI001CF76A7F|nr:cytochrome P450 [Roseomonas ponticola]